MMVGGGLGVPMVPLPGFEPGNSGFLRAATLPVCPEGEVVRVEGLEPPMTQGLNLPTLPICPHPLAWLLVGRAGFEPTQFTERFTVSDLHQ